MLSGNRGVLLFAVFFTFLQNAATGNMVLAEVKGERPEHVEISGKGESEVIRESEILFEEREGYLPEGEYMDQEGRQYWLKEWHLEPYKIPMRREKAERMVFYEEVEWGEQIPGQAAVTVKDKATGQQFCSEYPVLKKRTERERWIPDFKFTAVFHSYDADCFRLGTKRVPYNSLKPELEGCEQELLAEIGVKPEHYRILHAVWKGGPYFDENGELCRDAEVTGERKVADYYVTYGGEMTLPEAAGVKCIAVYRGFDAVTDGWIQAEERSVELTDFHSRQNRKKELWLVSRKSIIITLSIVLVAGVIFLWVLLVRKAFCKKGGKRS
ncbi:hypothetical protein AALB39_15275 [Lachnospiraceae bacterium 54-53]